MQKDAQLNYATHLSHISQASSDLLIFAKRTTFPAPIPHQFIGTVVDNTISLLTCPANAIDSGNRIVTFNADSCWLSLMSAVHRSFLSSIHTAAEHGLQSFLTQLNLTASPGINKRAQKAIDDIEQSTTELPQLAKKIKILRDALLVKHPSFSDYLKTALGESTLSNSQKKEWRKFFIALSIARNKVSHSKTDLSNLEINQLREGRLGGLVSKKLDLQFNPTLYKYIVELVLNFFDELMQTSKTKIII